MINRMALHNKPPLMGNASFEISYDLGKILTPIASIFDHLHKTNLK